MFIEMLNEDLKGYIDAYSSAGDCYEVTKDIKVFLPDTNKVDNHNADRYFVINKGAIITLESSATGQSRDGYKGCTVYVKKMDRKNIEVLQKFLKGDDGKALEKCGWFCFNVHSAYKIDLPIAYDKFSLTTMMEKQLKSSTKFIGKDYS